MNSDDYAKLIYDFKEKIVLGYNEDIYNLKNFSETASKLETSLWVLKDVFYNFNKELRKQFDESYDEEYEREANELEALEAYKSTKDVANVYQREIKWLKQQNQKLNDLLTKTKEKHKNCKSDLKSQNFAWAILKKDNDELREMIKGFLESHRKNLVEPIDESKIPKIQYPSTADAISNMVTKINNLIDEDTSSLDSKSSSAYKKEINKLNGVIDTLVQRLNLNY